MCPRLRASLFVKRTTGDAVTLTVKAEQRWTCAEATLFLLGPRMRGEGEVASVGDGGCEAENSYAYCNDV